MTPWGRHSLRDIISGNVPLSIDDKRLVLGYTNNMHQYARAADGVARPVHGHMAG